MRIALIGQAPFGAAVFERLVEDRHEIVGVFTPPEREGGRPDPLAQAAREAGIALQQPRRWQRRGVVDEEVCAAYEATKPELNVMAFVTQIIPSRVLEFPPLQTIQYHPSMLPKHRGRSAINHAIVEGDTMTGVTIFWVDEGPRHRPDSASGTRRDRPRRHDQLALPRQALPARRAGDVGTRSSWSPPVRLRATGRSRTI